MTRVATKCRTCGEPRDPKSRYALCPAHAIEYERQKVNKHYEVHHPNMRDTSEVGDSYNRRWLLRRTYERFGLKPGGVWKRVLDGRP